VGDHDPNLVADRGGCRLVLRRGPCPPPASHAAAEALVRVAPVTGGLVVADTAAAAPILYDPADATVVGHAAAGWRLVEGLRRGRGAMIADRDGARIAWNVLVPPGRARRLGIGMLPLYPDAGPQIAFST
jgi:hypothetical protein